MKLCEELVVRRGADAILAEGDFTAVSLLRALRRLGRRVPDDVAVIGWGNEQVAYWSDPPLTTVNYVFQKMVGTALDLLAGMIERPDERPARKGRDQAGIDRAGIGIGEGGRMKDRDEG